MWSVWDCLHPWKLLPCKGFQEEKTRGSWQCLHRWACTHMCTVWQLNPQLRLVYVGEDWLGRLLQPCAYLRPQVSSAFHVAKSHKGPSPLQDPARQTVNVETKHGGEQRKISQRAEQPFVSRFKLLGVTTPHAGDGSAGVLCSQLRQPIFRTGASVSPENMHWYATRLLHRKFYRHISVLSPDLSWKFWL